MEGINLLAAHLAHSFNNDLASIVGNLQLLRKRIGRDHGSSVLLDRIKTTVDRSRNLLARLSRLGGGETYLFEQVSGADLLDGLADLMKGLQRANVTLELYAAADLWPIVGDRNLLLQAMFGLVVNAYEAFAEGPGRI